MANCAHCGMRVDVDDRYCPQCGKRVVAEDLNNPATTQGTMDLSDVRYKLGMVYFKKGDYARAVEAWEKVLANNPENVELKHLLEDARSRQKKEV